MTDHEIACVGKADPGIAFAFWATHRQLVDFPRDGATMDFSGRTTDGDEGGLEYVVRIVGAVGYGSFPLFPRDLFLLYLHQLLQLRDASILWYPKVFSFLMFRVTDCLLDGLGVDLYNECFFLSCYELLFMVNTLYYASIYSITYFLSYMQKSI